MNIQELKQESEKISREISGLQSRQDALQKRIEEMEKEPALEWPVKDGDSVFFFDTDSDATIGERMFDECESVIDALKYNMWWRTEREARQWVKVHRALLDFQAELGPCQWDGEKVFSFIYYDEISETIEIESRQFMHTSTISFNCNSEYLKHRIKNIIDSRVFTEEDLIFYITYTPPRPRRVK